MANIAGNTNQLGVIPVSTTGQPGRPGRVTKGVGKNRPRIHLVSSKGKIPADVYASAIALKQAAKTRAAEKMPTSANKHPEMASKPTMDGMKGSHTGGNPGVRMDAHNAPLPHGVAKRKVPAHQNNPALAGRFTSAFKLHQADKVQADPNKDNPNDTPAEERAQKRLGLRT
jgi:hypothetical protein